MVRALVSEVSDAALQQLRRLPRLGSFLGGVMKEHVAHMRTLGYRYETEEELLLRIRSLPRWEHHQGDRTRRS